MRKKSTNTDYINTKTSSLNNTKKKILDIIDSTSTFDDRLKQKDEKLLDLEPTLHNDSDFNNIDKTESFINGNNSLNRLHTQEVDNFRASLLIVTEIKSNERIMDQRGKDLNEIYGVSNQLKEMTGNMKENVKKQQGLLGMND